MAHRAILIFNILLLISLIFASESGSIEMQGNQGRRLRQELIDFRTWILIKWSITKWIIYFCPVFNLFSLINWEAWINREDGKSTIIGKYILKVNKSQKQNWRKKLLPKPNRRICFSILTVRNHLKLEVSTSSFKYFRTVRIEKQIRPFVFGRSFFFVNFAFEIYWPLRAYCLIYILCSKIGKTIPQAGFGPIGFHQYRWIRFSSRTQRKSFSQTGCGNFRLGSWWWSWF